MKRRWQIYRGVYTKTWRAVCPGSLSTCQCESFATHAEAIAYAHRMAVIDAGHGLTS